MDLKYAIAAAFAAGAFVATPAIAQNAYSDSEPQFYRLDKNNDGNVDKAEAQAHPWMQRNFGRFDHDNDGKLGKDEFAEAVNAHRAAAQGNTRGAAGGTRPPDNAFESLDKNKDGNIDATEAQARPWVQRNFSKYDADHDGKLGKDEFAAAVNGQRAARDTRGAAGGTRPADDVFENLDKNKDGNIDTTEAQARPWLQKNFSQYDYDHNGKLGKDEFSAALNAQRSGRR